ncbi:transglutaminase family protein [Rhizosphaericola mali]|uniref:Transglutaminase family protein n=1 Tax=Rhizosphaericola mali TaxID=2545455 RepID=A0A5P2G621_9BACT|nr:transglutaminase family protein [Rhizosphaericola mali]QES90108.1 transglutaminase family protein [Rhizosphaericola mali]
MSIKVAIKHRTLYKYDRPVSLSPHTFRLRPAAHSRTPIESYSFKIKPKDHFINWQQDPFGNFQARVVFPEKTTELEVDVEVIARLEVINPFDFFVESYAETFPFKYTDILEKELAPYLEIMDDGPLLDLWVKENIDVSKPTSIVDFLVDINQKVNQNINYSIRMEPGVQTPDFTLQKSLGSCRDSGWLLVQALRKLGLAARFVSGYLVQLSADEKSLDGPSGPEADFTDLHAWAEVYIPGAGWIGLDATSGLFAGEGHIPLACTPDYRSAAPVVGASDKAEVTFEFENKVTRIFEDPRVTKPYTEQQWNEINAVGEQVDKDLFANDVRLTMGGEPTFVSIDDMESAQWNTAADGKEKRILSHDLIFRLRDSFGPNGLIHYGQGKWYPGEPLPRWQYGLYWRKDGFPVWKNPNLIAHEKTKHNYNTNDAKIFAEELCKNLAISTDNISSAYEDAFFFLWSEGKVPFNVDPLKANLKDSLERRTLANLLDKGLENPAGFVIPIEWNYWNNTWLSCEWKFNRQHLFLIPGNSPIGLRLPLNSLPVISKASSKVTFERSPFEEVTTLPQFEEAITRRYGTVTPFEEAPKREIPIVTKEKEEKKKKEPEEIEEDVLFEIQTIKTAISIEIREGILYLFLPPVQYIEHYLDLIASIEATADKLAIPVRIEGYEPPRDNRVEKIVVSPDPGVIEVNIHPSQTWGELKSNIETLYEQARLSRLGTEKFMLDGRHTGTGGGNHVTVGGDIPANSPLLRRPDLLQSIITFWQHHPALSYLFSGPFIGPTSQAPRIDEGRLEKLYEMEIAFSEVPTDGFIPYWLVDRIFRHLLTDITGNTHRSELCIDKLYSPDSSSGRLGILEFRGFDMPPHRQMSLLQILLVRALISAFWKKPYKHDLVRWGTELHDKFLLPHFIEKDIEDVVKYLNNQGYEFKSEWFAPFVEFRFPRYGTIQLEDIQMNIHMGIEPWHVLGEEMSSAGTARFVDSSLERVQVKINGLNSDRYILLCNGARVPLTPTAKKGEFICGIRYRAWQPPSALHPTIGIDAPLTFDIVDTWNGLSIGGCTYYVSHPGGRSYDTFPINAYEAESRRFSRFGTTSFTQDVLFKQPHLHVTEHYVENNRKPFVYDAPPIAISNEYPCTLDLRKIKK